MLKETWFKKYSKIKEKISYLNIVVNMLTT